MNHWTTRHGDALRGRRTLVTGGAGFIGSHLIEALLALDADVVALDDLSHGSWANLEPFGKSVQQVTASISDTDALARAVDGCELVFHQAALGSVPASVNEPVGYQRVNVMGTVNVLEAARRAGVRRVMFAASSSAYGDIGGDEPKVETLAPAPLSPYAASKCGGEHLVRAWAHSYDIDTVTLRYFNIFGPRQSSGSAYAAVIAAFAAALQAGDAPIIYGDGEQSRDFTYIDNVVHANLLAATHAAPLRGQVFNVATGQRVTVNDLFQRMAMLADRSDVNPRYLPTRTGDIRHSLADIRRIREAIGYEPLVDFDEGLKRTWAWFSSRT